MEALHHFAYQLCHDEQGAKDLVQETLLKAFRYFHTYREGTNCRAWLFQICKNSFINDLRRKTLMPAAVTFVDEFPDTADAYTERDGGTAMARDDHDLRLHEQLLGDEVQGALHQLPPEYQTALVLCDIEGYAYEEIAEMMQAPIGTIRSRIHRARAMLERRLEGYARSRGWAATRRPRQRDRRRAA
jgi:RNA polymerase sigma-70 factor (ECF subfamily)